MGENLRKCLKYPQDDQTPSHVIKPKTQLIGLY